QPDMSQSAFHSSRGQEMDRDGSWSRRRLLGSLAAAGAAGYAPDALAQGACRDGYGQGRCPLPKEEATAPIREVFAPTGWKTVALESFTIDVVDYRKEAAFYAALLGWKLREDDGKRAIMDVGNWGSCILRGAAPSSFGPGVDGAPPPRAAVRSFAWVIDKWDARKVADTLHARELRPVAENRGAFQSFRVRDPDGWDLQICNNQGLSAARRKPSSANWRRRRPSVPPAGAPSGWIISPSRSATTSAARLSTPICWAGNAPMTKAARMN
ncbi:MAG TPA: VOC family protein, partial [Rhizomicrobium sp.]|nr:VOC family protein [Rhizomicrobium sp.]